MMYKVLDTSIGFEDVISTLKREYFPSIKANSKVLILLDMYAGIKSPESGAICNPELLKNVILNIFEQCNPSHIFLAMSNDIEESDTIFTIYEISNLSKIYPNISCIDLDNYEQVRVKQPNFNKMGSITISEVIILADYIINIANLKTHVYEKMSGCCLNLIQIITGRYNRLRFQPINGQLLPDLQKIAAPDLNILDCTCVLTNTGPVEGFPIKLDRLIISDDMLVTDIIGARLLDIEEEKITHLKCLIAQNREKISLISYVAPQYHYSDQSMNFRLLNTLHRITRIILLYSENFASLIQLVLFAYVAIGPSRLLKGRWIPIFDYVRIACGVLTRFEEPQNFLAWKVTINKHIEQESIS